MDHERYRRMHGRPESSMKTVSFEIPLKSKEQIAEATWAFVFEKPDGFRFKAGQHIRMTLIDPPETDSEGNSRFFSLASTPREPDLVIAMRMRDTAFKRVLRRMQIGERVIIQMLLDAPHEAFALREDPSKPAIFLAGGIGIVPAYSMIRDAIERRLPHRILLFYSNRHPQDASYLEDLQSLAEQTPSFSLTATMTDAEESGKSWGGETGRINQAMLTKHVKDLTSPIYYISGLPEMVSAMKTMLGSSGVPDSSIHAEEFTGFNLNEIRDGGGHAWRRPILIVSIMLAVIAAVILHSGAAVLISRSGVVGVFRENPFAYAMVGIVLVAVILKMKFGLHFIGRRRHGGHAPPSNARKRARHERS